MKMIVRAMLCVVFVTATSKGEFISILKHNYWKRILYEENDINIPVPNGLHYSASETLILLENQSLVFTELDYTKYTIGPKRNKPTLDVVKDNAGNKIFNLHGSLFYEHHKATNTALAKIVSNDVENFKECVLDTKRNIAYLIGLGRLFAMNTIQPIKIADKILVEEFSKLGQNLKAISLDTDTGNVAIIEANQNIGWRLILLVINDFTLLIDENPEMLPRKNKTAVVNVETPPGLRNKFNSDVREMTNNIVSFNSEECQRHVARLLIDNKRLKYQLLMMGNAHHYLLKGNGIYLSSPNVGWMNAMDSINRRRNNYDGLKNEFESIVENLGKNISAMLNEETVHWLDEGNCKDKIKPTDIGKKITSCGLMKDIPTNELFPWTVAVLVSPSPYKFICYGTLIHPKVVLISSDCSDEYEKHVVVIARSGILDNSLLNTEQPETDRKVVGKMFDGIRALILDEEFTENGKIGVACLPVHEIKPEVNAACYGLPQQSTMSTAEVFDFSKVEVCNPKVADSRFFCIVKFGARNSQCKALDDGMYMHAVYCPYPDNPKRYMVYGIYYEWNTCTQVFVNQATYTKQTISKLRRMNINMTSFF